MSEILVAAFLCAFGHNVQKREGEICKWNQ